MNKNLYTHINNNILYHIIIKSQTSSFLRMPTTQNIHPPATHTPQQKDNESDQPKYTHDIIMLR